MTTPPEDDDAGEEEEEPAAEPDDGAPADDDGESDDDGGAAEEANAPLPLAANDEDEAGVADDEDAGEPLDESDCEALADPEVTAGEDEPAADAPDEAPGREAALDAGDDDDGVALLVATEEAEEAPAALLLNAGDDEPTDKDEDLALLELLDAPLADEVVAAEDEAVEVDDADPAFLDEDCAPVVTASHRFSWLHWYPCGQSFATLGSQASDASTQPAAKKTAPRRLARTTATCRWVFTRPAPAMARVHPSPVASENRASLLLMSRFTSATSAVGPGSFACASR